MLPMMHLLSSPLPANFSSAVRSSTVRGVSDVDGVRSTPERNDEAHLFGGSRAVDGAICLLRPMDPYLHLLDDHVPHGSRAAQQVRTK